MVKTPVKATSKAVATPEPMDYGVTLVVDEKGIDNPTFPVRWQFSDELLGRIHAGVQQGHGYAVLLRARNDLDDHRHFEVRGVSESLQYFQLVEIPRAGTWHFEMLLFERTVLASDGERTTSVLAAVLRQMYLETEKNWRKSPTRTKYDKYLNHVVDIPLYDKEKGNAGQASINAHYPEYGAVVAKHVLTITISPEVFPAEPPAWLSAYGNYFWGGEMPYDQCDFRWRLLAMIPGFFPWLFFELLKRGLLFVGSILMLLFWIEDWWRVGDQALEPAVNLPLAVPGFEGNVHEDLQGPQFFVLTPGVLALYYGLYRLFAFLWDKVSEPVVGVTSSVVKASGHSGWVTPVALALMAFLTLYLARNRIANSVRKWWKEGEPAREKAGKERKARRDTRMAEQQQRTIAHGVHEASLILEFAPVLTSAAPVVVDLEAVPKALRPRGFNWLSLFKRDHCAPYG